MDLRIVESLSDDALQALSDKVKEVLHARMNQRLCAGAVVRTFNDKTKREMFIRVARVNAKTLSGMEVNQYGDLTPNACRWKASLSMCSLVSSPLDLKKVPVYVPPVAYHPASLDDAW